MNVSPASGGSIKVNGTAPPTYPTALAFSPGTNVAVEAIPALNFVFKNWSGDLTGTVNPTVVAMTCDKSITANFTSTSPATVGDLVWEDNNQNGIRDTGEPGVPHVTVNLFDSANHFISTAATDANGIYHFTGLTPGQYYLEFIAPQGYVFTVQHQGGDNSVDSDADPVTGRTDTFTLNSGGIDYTWDAGLRWTGHDMSLVAGWNLISFPYYVEPEDRDPGQLLAPVLGKLNAVHAYNACAAPGQGGWSTYAPYGPSDLAVMRDGPGYWLYMSALATLRISGNALPDPPEPPPTYTVCEGWNLIGFKSDAPKLASQYLSGIAGKYAVIYTFVNGLYSVVGSQDNFMPGYGYWIAVTQPGTIYSCLDQVIDDVTPAQAYALIQSNQGNPDFVILDVRTPAEYATGHIADAINLDYRSPTFADQLNLLDRNKTYLVYCKSGARSASALQMMRWAGFREAHNMLGGILQWQAEGYPVVN